MYHSKANIFLLVTPQIRDVLTPTLHNFVTPYLNALSCALHLKNEEKRKK